MILVAFRHHDHRLASRIICALRGGDVAHCESAIPVAAQAWCVSSSMLDGGVRGKLIDITDAAKWRVYRVPDGQHADLAAWLFANDGAGYDYLGNLGILWRPFGHSRRRWFCSEAVADHLHLRSPELYDPRTLESIVESLFTRVEWVDGIWAPAAATAIAPQPA